MSAGSETKENRMNTWRQIADDHPQPARPQPSWSWMRDRSRALCLAWSEWAGEPAEDPDRRPNGQWDPMDDYLRSDYFFRF